MLPSGSDNFVISDFDDTFTKLDGAPGITPVASYSSLPSTLTTAQHGSIYLALDNGALWQWNKPGAGAGVWVKLNTVGGSSSGSVLVSASQVSTISTATTTEASGPSIMSASYTDPGGRSKAILFTSRSIQNNGPYGGSRVTLWYDGSIIHSSNLFGGWFTGISGVTHTLFMIVPPGTPGSTHTVNVTLSSIYYGTSTTDNTGKLFVWEI